MKSVDRPSRLGAIVMEILGHSQIAVTMNVYTHAVQDTQRDQPRH
ncbi:hypothetical protein [Streptomyces sp. NPDC056785]